MKFVAQARFGLLLSAVMMSGMAPLASAQAPKPAAKAPEKPSSQAALRQFAAATALQKRELYDLAIDEWNKFLATFAADPLVEKAQYNMAVCYYASEKDAQAADLFGKFVAAYPKSELLESALFNYGKSQFNVARAGMADFYAKAGSTFSSFIEKFPQGKLVANAMFLRGEALYYQGKKQEAITAYEEVVKRFPSDPGLPDTLYSLGVAQTELHQPAAADATFGAFLKQFPQHPLAAEVCVWRGDVLSELGKPAEAEKLFATAAGKSDFPKAEYALRREADSLYEQNKFPQAQSLYASIPAKYPKSSDLTLAYKGAGVCAHLSGKYAEARTYLAKALPAGGEVAAECTHWLAVGYLKEQKAAEALKVVDQAIPNAGKTAHSVQLQLDRGDALYEMPDKRRESIAVYADLAKKHPQDPLAPQSLYNAAYTALIEGQHDAALTYANDFLKQYGKHKLAPDAMFVGGESNLAGGHYSEANKLYADLLKNYGSHVDADLWRVRQGWSLFRSGQFADVVTTLDPIAGRLATKDLVAEAQYLIGASQSELKHYDPARKALEASFAAAPQHRLADETLLLLAAVYAEAGKLPEARAKLSQLISQFPQSKTLDRAHVLAGDYAERAGDLSAATTAYKLVLDKFPESARAPYALDQLGYLQYRQGDYEGAIRTVDALLAKYPSSELAARSRYTRGLARTNMKQYGPAIDDLQAFLKSNPPQIEKSAARYSLALCQAGLKQAADAVKTLESLLAEDRNYTGADKALDELAWNLKGIDKPAEAAVAFGRLAKEYPASPLAAQALYMVGEHQYQQKDFASAARSYDAAREKAKTGEIAEKASYKEGLAYFHEANYPLAQQWFHYQREVFPQGSLAGDATFLEAEALFKQDKFAEALAIYEQVKNATGKNVAVVSLLHAGQAAQKIEPPQWQRSLDLFTKAAKDFPESEYLPEIVYGQGYALDNLGNVDEALKFYEAVTARTDGEVAARARFKVGEIYFKKKDYNEALKNFFRVAYGYSAPEWQAASTFEAGQCLRNLKKSTQAVAMFKEVVEKYPQDKHAKLAQENLKTLGGQ